MKSLKIFLLSFILLFVLVSVAFTQEDVALDEDIQPEELGVGKPTILPDHLLYPLKNGWRKVQEFFTFNPVAKIKLKERFASEKIIELKELTKKGADFQVVERAIENYKKESEEVKERVMQLKQKVEDSPEINSFLEKFTHQETLHYRILQKLENQVPPEVLEKIKQERERHLERFGDVMLKLEEKEKIQERLERATEKVEGSKYKNFKNLEMLIELEEKVPEQAKEAIQKAQENALKRLKNDLQNMSPEDQEGFGDYLEEISGKEEVHLEILEDVKLDMPEGSEIRNRLEEGKGKIFEKIEKRAGRANCPQFTPPSPDFCEKGRVIFEQNPQGCPLPPRCIIPREVECQINVLCEEGYIPQSTDETDSEGCPIMQCVEEEVGEETVCITLWDPVCGVDGKTYSNECFAQTANVEIDYQGVCEEE